MKKEIFYSSKGFIDNTEIHHIFSVITIDRGVLHYLKCSNKRIKKFVTIASKVTCKKCLKWENKVNVS